MNRILFIVLVGMIMCSGIADAQVKMRDVFAELPQEVLPLMTKNNRLDCIDFIENNMQARVRNTLDEYVTLEALTDNYLKLTTSSSGQIELLLLPADISYLIVLVRTSIVDQTHDSSIEFYTPDWNQLPTSHYYTMPELDEFFSTNPSTDEQKQAYQELADYHPVSISIEPKELSLELTLQNYDIEVRKHASIADIVRTVVMQWDGAHFVRYYP